MSLREVRRLCRLLSRDVSKEHRDLVRCMEGDFGFPAGMCSESVTRNFSSIADILPSYFSNASFFKEKSSRVIIAPSNVPEPLFFSVTAAAVLERAEFHLKYSGRTMKTGSCLRRIFSKGLNSFRKRVYMSDSKSDLRNALQDADYVSVFGNDRTVSEVRTQMQERAVCMMNGGHVSFGVFDIREKKPFRVKSLAHKCAYDIRMYDQRGCFSPQAFFVRGDLKLFASELFLALQESDRQHECCRRTFDQASEREVVKGRIVTDRRYRCAEIFGDYASSGPLVYKASESSTAFTGGYQMIGIHPYRSEQQLIKRLEKIRHPLRAVSVSGLSSASVLRKTFRDSLKADWICAPGRIQFPPADFNFRLMGF